MIPEYFSQRRGHTHSISSQQKTAPATNSLSLIPRLNHGALEKVFRKTSISFQPPLPEPFSTRFHPALCLWHLCFCVTCVSSLAGSWLDSVVGQQHKRSEGWKTWTSGWFQALSYLAAILGETSSHYPRIPALIQEALVPCLSRECSFLVKLAPRLSSLNPSSPLEVTTLYY